MNRISKYKLMQHIEDYHWMIDRVRQAELSYKTYEGAKIAQYGIEAAMPKASGGSSDPVFNEVYRRTVDGGKRVAGYKNAVLEVQERMHLVTSDREQEILHMLLNGDSLSYIGKIMKTSATSIFRAKERIVDKMLKA